MSMIIPPGAPMPQAQTVPAAPQQVPTAVQSAAAVTALPVGNQTRQAAVASGSTGNPAGARREKGSKSDSNAAATEAKTTGPRPRGMGRKADLSV